MSLEPQVLAAAVATAVVIATVSAVVFVLWRWRRATIEARHLRDATAHATRVAALGGITASITHEINQSLGAILSNAEAAEILLDSNTPPLDEVRQILRDIQRDGLRANAVIRHVRAFLVHRGAQRERVDIGAVIDAVLTLVAPTASRAGVAILVERTGAAWVMGDPVQLQQALLNVVLNGIEAMHETVAERRLELDVLQREQDVVIGVADRGPGIDAALEARLFDWCFTTKEDGLGLGLPTAQMLIGAHGGRILVANRADGGTRVEIRLPRG